MKPSSPRGSFGSEWQSRDHALSYLDRADDLPHRREGERVLADLFSGEGGRVLDLGTGDGRLLDLLLDDQPQRRGIGLDFSDVMLDLAAKRFASNSRVTLVRHDLSQPLPDLGRFDAVVSCFAIHHLPHERKRALYAEAFHALRPEGWFANLDHVASPTDRLHSRFYWALGCDPRHEDRSNHLLDVGTQLYWLRGLGLEDVDCHWKWLEMALLAGVKPAQPAQDHPKVARRKQAASPVGSAWWSPSRP